MLFYFNMKNFSKSARKILWKHGLFQVREEEVEELDALLSSCCELSAPGGAENSHGKINILLQTYISRGEMDSFSLISDSAYVAQVRISLPFHHLFLVCSSGFKEVIHTILWMCCVVTCYQINHFILRLVPFNLPLSYATYATRSGTGVRFGIWIGSSSCCYCFLFRV